MPLETQIQDTTGKLLRLHWGDFHIAAMVLAATFDSGQGPFKDNHQRIIMRANRRLARRYPVEPMPIGPMNCFQLASYPVISATPMDGLGYVLKRTHRFLDTRDGELLELFPGYRLIAFRSW